MKIVACVCSLFALVLVPAAFAGKTELTTYYPSPYGEYTNLNVSGNVGIGTTTPATRLHVVGQDIGMGSSSSPTAYARIGIDNGYYQYVANNAYHNSAAGPTAYYYVNTAGYSGMATRMTQYNGDLWFDTASGGVNPISWNTRMYITNSGNVGIGTTGPAGKLDVQGAATYNSENGPLMTTNTTVPAKKISIGYDNTNDIGFISCLHTGVAWKRLVLQGQGGNVGIGMIAPTYALQLNGQPAANGFTLWTNYSDARLKENIKKMGEGTLEKILKLNPSTFQYNDKYFQVTGYSRPAEQREMCGFVAQEMEKVFPDMVREKELPGGDYLETNLTNLQIYLVKAMQEQQAEIEFLKKEIAELKRK